LFLVTQTAPAGVLSKQACVPHRVRRTVPGWPMRRNSLIRQACRRTCGTGRLVGEGIVHWLCPGRRARLRLVDKPWQETCVMWAPVMEMTCWSNAWDSAWEDCRRALPSAPPRQRMTSYRRVPVVVVLGSA